MLNMLALCVCVCGAAFGAGSEIALVSASRLRMQHLAKEGVRGASRILTILDDKDQILWTMLIVTNVLHIAGGVVATILLTQWLGNSLGPVVATLGMTSIFLVFSEIVPKVYCRHHADNILIRTGLFWSILSRTLAPVVWPAKRLSILFFKFFRKSPKSLHTSREEIKLLLEEAVEEGELRRQQQEMLESALDYATTTVRQVMVPMSDVAILPESAKTEELLLMVRDLGHTRVPIFRERVDQIVGLVNVFDVIFDEGRKTFVRSYMRPARLVPETKPVDQLFVELQRNRESLAIVVNEFGACYGIVTLEDILEEIFGELADEHEDATPEIREIGPGHFRVSGRTDLDDLKDETDIELVKEGFETINGYILHRLGRIPRQGETIVAGTVTIQVVEADRYCAKVVDVIRGGEY